MLRNTTTIAGLIGVFIACLTATVAGQAEWPGFRGPNFDGTVPEVDLFDGKTAGLSVGWKRALGSGYSAVAVANGHVVTMFADGDADYIGAFDIESGDEVWRYRIADLHAGHDGSHDGPISTPLVAGGRIFGLGARGDLFAVDANNGEEIWKIHLVDDLGARAPYYGFTTSPLMADGVLVVAIGSEEQGKAIAGFDPEDGTVLWTLGHDTIEYHSPIVATIGERRQVVAAGQNNVYGLDPGKGTVLWSYEHAGDERAMGGFTIVPVPAGDGRLFLMNKIDSSTMLSVKRDGDAYAVEELWTSNGLKQSYVQPVYHDGYLYGMSNRIFTCIDAVTGEVVWRSRQPGDGFPTRVGEHLVVITKPGSLHVVAASPDGYEELAQLDLFEELSWSEVAYAGGHLFARSMKNLARIDPGITAVVGDAAGPQAAATDFDAFLAELEQAADKARVIDAYLARQSSFPIVDDMGGVHFVYRGEAEDVGIVGDMIGVRREDPMTRVDGTDLFHYSTRLEPDAALSYGFIVDYAEPAADPLNPRAEPDALFGEVSWFSMPAWRAPDFGEPADTSKQGRLESVEWQSEAMEGQERTARVYLPAGYDEDADRRYPTLYVHHGAAALENGEMNNALDHLIGRSIDPVIAVFVIADEEDPRADLRNREPYTKMVIEELVPMIDERYRTVAEPMARASVGSGRAASVALSGAFENPEVFGRTAGQSALIGGDSFAEQIAAGPDERPMVIYLDWGTYHMRSPHEAWDVARNNREFWSALRDAGYRPAGGEVPEGFGWGCWKGHTEEMLAALFPLSE